MKKLIVSFALCVAGFSLQAQDIDVKPASSYSVTADFKYSSQYVFRGIRQSNDAAQASVEIASQGFYAGVWGSQPFNNDVGREFDFYAGYSFALNKMWKVDLGATAYYYPQRNTQNGTVDRITTEVYAGIVGAVNGFTPAAYVYHDFDLKTTTVEASLGYSFHLTPKASLDVTGSVGDVARDSVPDYYYYGVGVAVPYKLTDRVTVTGSLNYASQNLQYDAKDLVWVSVGVTYTF